MKNSIYFIAAVFLLNTFMISVLNAQDLSVAFEKDTTFKDISTVRVLGYYSKVTINRSNDEKIMMHAVLKADNPEGYGIKTITTNKALELRVSFPEQGWSSHAGELTLRIPDSVKVDIQTTSGYCTIYDISPGKLNISTKSGKINIDKCNGDMILASASGDIFLDEITGNVNVKTKTGDIQILRTKGDIITHTTLGNTHLNNIIGNIKTESTSGKQDMENIKGNIFARSMSGIVKVSVAEGDISVIGSTGDVQLFQTKGILDIKTTKGNQSGTRIDLTGNSTFTSTEGKIKMRFITPKDKLAYELMSEKAFVFALGKSKKKKLNIGKGNILVKAVTTTGAQSFY